MNFCQTVSLICGLALPLILAGSAQAALCDPATSSVDCLGSDCRQIGSTTLDFGQKNIIACLKDDSTPPKLKWKAMSQSSGGGVGSCYALSPAGIYNGRNFVGYSVTSLDPLPADTLATNIAAVSADGMAVTCKAGYSRSGCVLVGADYRASAPGLVANGCAASCYTDSNPDNPSTTCSSVRTICCKTQ